MTHTPISIAIVGCGRLTQRGYLPALQRAREVRLAGLCDTDPHRLAEAAATAGRVLGETPAAFAGINETIAAAPDALVIAAPTQAHLPLARAAAAAGITTLIEKPPAATQEEAHALARLEPRPYIGFNRRFLQGAVRDAVPRDGWVELDLELSYRRAGWGAHEAGDPALLDAGIHLIDLASFVTRARPLAVRRARLESEEAFLELELSRGRGRITASTAGRYRERLSVADRGGATLAEFRLGRLRGIAERFRGRAEPLAGSLAAQLEALAAAAEGGAPPAVLAGADDGLRAMQVVEAARRSASLGGAEVTIEQDVRTGEAAAAPLAGAGAP